MQQLIFMFACLNSFSFIVFIIAIFIIIIFIIIISSARVAREGGAEGHVQHRDEAALAEGTDGTGWLG